MASRKQPVKLKTRFITRADVEEMEKAVQMLAARVKPEMEVGLVEVPDGPRSGRCPAWCPLRRLKQRRR